ncbi:MAG: choice-of-anchor D domain-containing protein, partial [Actinobacteria bacterium]|nr:choice-of-anchor D domain-containing protein [Actinomycetota bacterium]
MKRNLGFPRPGLIGLAVLLCALLAPAAAHAAAGISVSPSSVNFGNQDILDEPLPIQYKTVTVYSVGSVGSTLVIGTVAVSGTTAIYEVQDNCSGAALDRTAIETESCTVVLAFDPATAGAHTGSLVVPSNAGPNVSVSLTGNGTATGEFSPNPQAQSFGQVDVFAGAPVSAWFRITNSGSATLTIGTVSIAGTNAVDFTIGEQNCAGATLAISGYCDVRAVFDPLNAGSKAANLHFTHNGAGGASDIALMGTGIWAIFSPSSTSLSFGARSTGAGGLTQSVTITNTGNHPLSISYTELQGTDPGEFAVVGTAANTCDDGPVPAAGGTCTLPVQFDPTGAGAKSASLRVWHNDPTTETSGQSTIALNGTGTQSEATASPSLLEYDVRDIYSGPSAPKTVTVTNSGSEPLTVNSATLSGATPGDFAITGGTCTVSPPVNLGIGDTCTYTVTFDPSDDAEGRIAELQVNHSGVNTPSVVDLAGLGMRPRMEPFPSELSFEERVVGAGASLAKWVRYENYGSGPLTMGEQTLAGGDASEFSIYFNDCTGRTLVPSEFCDIAVSFDPQSPGAKSAVLRTTHAPMPLTVTDVPLTGSA